MQVDQEGLLTYLRANNVDFALENHARIFTMAESDQLVLKLEGMRCKNLLLRDRKSNYYLVVTASDKPVDLATLGRSLGCGRLSLAMPDRLLELLGVIPGALSPLSLINDRLHKVKLLFDQVCEGDLYMFHPLDNAASVQLTLEMFQRFLDSTGHQLNWVAVPERI